MPFFFASGSQFEEVYVGLGAKRIRELFEAAKNKTTAAIIFIDEIDALGGSRKLKDQRAMKHTLNELLVQMDGVGSVHSPFRNNHFVLVHAMQCNSPLMHCTFNPKFEENSGELMMI